LKTMRKHHPKNERIKRQYFIWLKEAKKLSPQSIDQKAAAIALFEASTNYKDFAAFHIEQARNFKRQQAEANNETTGKPLAKATMKARFDALKAFFFWLADQQGYRSKIRHSDADYFNMSANDTRIATAKRQRPSPELDEVHFVIEGMKAETPFEKRTRAIVACALLTGARDDAMASLSLRHVDLRERFVSQDARDVRTKFRKSFTTWFFPVGGQAEAIIGDWVAYLQTEWKFGPNDPLFPATAMGIDGTGTLGPIGFTRERWKNADGIRKAFKQAFRAVGLPYYNPHSIRATLARLGQIMCRTPEELKAWSQNLGHSDVLVTFTSYGQVASHRQADIILNMRDDHQAPQHQNVIGEIEALLARAKLRGKAA
jgi:integrase